MATTPSAPDLLRQAHYRLPWALLLASAALAAPAAGATVRFDPDVYRVREGQPSLTVTLGVEAAECPGETIEVLEGTATLSAIGETAVAGEDFRPPSPATVPLGGSRTRIPHRLVGLVIDDLEAEGTETFRLTLSVSAGARIRCVESDRIFDLEADPQAASPGALVEILGNDAGGPSLLSVGDVRVREGDTGITPALFRVRLDPPSGVTVTVEVETTDGTASVAEGDYVPVRRQLVFQPGETEKRVVVRVNGDFRDEGAAETFSLRLFAPRGARLGRGRATGTIVDDDEGGLELTIVGGDGQSGAPGETLPEELAVRLTTGEGEPVAAVRVTWSSTSERAGLDGAVSTTDLDGRAAIQVTLSGPAGAEEVTASVAIPDFQGSVTFHLLVTGDPDIPEDPCREPWRLPPALRERCETGGRFPPRARPQDVPAQGTTAIEGVRLHHRLVRDRVNAVRGGKGDGAPRPLSAFAAAGSTSGSRPAGESESGFTFDLLSLAFGADQELPGGFLLGGAVGWTTGDARLRDDGRLDAETLSGTLYGAYQAGLSRFHLEAALTWGRQRFDLERTIVVGGPPPRLPAPVEVARSRPEGEVWAFSLGGGTGVDFGPWRFEGLGSLSWARAEIDPYTEHGAGDFDLAVEAQRQTSLLGEAGFQVQYRKGFEHWGLGVYAGGALAHELADDPRSIVAGFANGPDPLVRVAITTEPPDRDFVRFEAGLAAKLPGPWGAYLNYSQEVNRDDLESRSLLVGVLLQF